MKERLGLTEIRKHANRMTFAEVGSESVQIRTRSLWPRWRDLMVRTSDFYIRYQAILVVVQIEDDAYQEDLGFSLGQLGKSGSGRVRQAQVNDATKARISKSLQVGAALVPPRCHQQLWFQRCDSGLLCLHPSANAAEAEHDLRRQVHGPGPLLGNQLQRSLHSPTGETDGITVF